MRRFPTSAKTRMFSLGNQRQKNKTKLGGKKMRESRIDIIYPAALVAAQAGTSLRAKTSGAYTEVIGIGPELVQIHWPYISLASYHYSTLSNIVSGP